MSLEIATLSDSSAGTTAKILVGFGFNCFQFQARIDEQPIEVLWSEPGFEDGDKHPSGSGVPILFPFPGRIPGTKLAWKGREYTLQPGDGQGNAIHGFVHQLPWRVIAQAPDRITGQFQSSLDAPELLESWPADFRITVEHQLRKNCLTTRFQIENPDQSLLPCGLGVHPYFRVPLAPGGSADDCVIQVPVCDRWELTNLTATGKRLPLAESENLSCGLRFGNSQFDSIFSVAEFPQGRCTATLQDPSSGLTMSLSFDEVFRQCVVYNPPHREAICIEPYSCVPCPFELEKKGIDSGLKILQPGESFEAEIEIRLEKHEPLPCFSSKHLATVQRAKTA